MIVTGKDHKFVCNCKVDVPVHICKKLREFGVPEDRITELVYGVLPEKMVRPKKVPSECMRFVFLGSAEPIKGLQTVMAALDPLPDDLPFEITPATEGAVFDVTPSR